MRRRTVVALLTVWALLALLLTAGSVVASPPCLPPGLSRATTGWHVAGQGEGPDVEDEAVPSIYETVNRWITTSDGSVDEPEVWGRRRLAYLIRNFGEGIYILQRFQLPPEQITELERTLKLYEDVIRYLVVLEEVPRKTRKSKK